MKLWFGLSTPVLFVASSWSYPWGRMGVGGRQDSWDSLVGGFLAGSPEELLRFTSLGSSIPTHRALGWDLDPVLTGSGVSLRILLTLPPRGSLTSRSKISALQKVEKEAGLAT